MSNMTLHTSHEGHQTLRFEDQTPRRVRSLRRHLGLGPAVGVGTRYDGRLDATNSDSVVVRGMERYQPPVTLWATTYYGEKDLTQVGAWAWRQMSRSWRWDWTPEGPRTDAEHAQWWASGNEATRLSKLAATHAAGVHLGLPSKLTSEGLIVMDVKDHSPLRDTLRVGDVLTHVDGARITSLQDGAGQLRDGTELQVAHVNGPVRTHALTGDKLGLVLANYKVRQEGGLDAVVGLSPECSGPSAGLMMALGLLDVLTPGSITGGMHVAGTGTIDAQGDVGPVSGVGWKAAAANVGGAVMFLCPRGSGGEAREGARRTNMRRHHKDRMSVVEVADLTSAVDVLVSHGGIRPSIPR